LGPYSEYKTGVHSVVVTARMPSIYLESPAEYYCQGSYSLMGSAGGGRSETWSRTAPFWGSYLRFFWNYDIVDYISYNCSHSGMRSDVTMVSGPPGWPDVGNPPPYMGDEGYRHTSPILGALFINFFTPRSTPGPCIEAQ
jgi:hypothetical protein